MGGIAHYGVWVGQPTRYEAQTLKQDPKSPHIYLYFTDGSSSSSSSSSSSKNGLEAAINVLSTDKDNRLVFWVTRSFSNAITTQLSALDEGFHLLSDYAHRKNNTRSTQHESHSHNHSHHHSSRHTNDTDTTLQGLDFIRTQGLLDIKSGKVLPTEADNLSELEPILTDAINQKATIYIFGSSYGSGIHDIHMNQGSAPSYDNGIYEDGALLFKFPDGHWEAAFIAFASQKIPTNDKGEYESNSQSLATILGDPESSDN